MLPPYWRASADISSSDICDKDQKKCSDVRSISQMNTTDLYWFRLLRGVIVLCPVSLYYDIKFDVFDRLWVTTFIV
jgi:hypothetical protein